MTAGNGSGRPVALVTGGSRGIGGRWRCGWPRQGTTSAFCLPDATPPRPPDAGKGGVGLAGSALAVTGRTSDAAAVKALVAATEDGLGPVDAVVTCAGIDRDNPLLMMRPGRLGTEVATSTCTASTTFAGRPSSR